MKKADQDQLDRYICAALTGLLTQNPNHSAAQIANLAVGIGIATLAEVKAKVNGTKEKD